MYPDPEATCGEIDPCYVCDWGSGVCEPAEDCPNQNECCRGYTCNTFSHCERNLDCDTDLDCAIDFTCNQETKQCQYVSCCGDCGAGSYCNESTCECITGCRDFGEPCDQSLNNCCEGLRCALLGICVPF
jgi:hypothetical protein